ncbi:4-oxalocrotonate tautomerase family enzyme [Campylobacter coli 80352]|uniref:4-oxalocrotonate tautomerase family enzyme n=1 Tax=Campylobacter coli 80352 TaxID=887288 RepID=A0ABP2NQW0_CAMCO|nr:4-oxalocrotonate tautomerase family enzyme [Campylobacter coli 80352]
MPFVNIRITKENGEPTSEQKQELIAGGQIYSLKF